MGCSMAKVLSQPHYLNCILMGLLGASAIADGNSYQTDTWAPTALGTRTRSWSL